MNATQHLRELHALLSRYRFNFCNEAELQFGIAQVLSASRLHGTIEREYRLSATDRLDFLIGGNIAIEIKIGGSAASVMRQVSRYAEHEQIQGILLVTARASHSLPESFNNKPLMVLSLVDGGL